MPPFPVYGIMPKRNSMCQRKRGRFRFIYAEEHYVEALSGKSWFGDSDIREAARANLELLDRLGGE